MEAPKDTFQRLFDSGTFDYGETIDRSELLRTFGVIKMTDDDIAQWHAKGMSIEEIKERFDEEDLNEMRIADKLRVWLLHHGRYLQYRDKNYRVLLPSENRIIADSYFKAGINKNNRGQLLIKNTPAEYTGHNSTEMSKSAVANQTMKRKLARN